MFSSLRAVVFRAVVFAALALLLCPILLVGIAHAGEAGIPLGEMFGDVRGTIQVVANTVIAGVVSLAGWGYWRLTGQRLDETYRNALQSALENGVHYALGLAQASLAGRTIATSSDLIPTALRYVREYAPDAIRHFGLTDDKLTQLLRAQLAKLLPAVPGADT